MVDLLLVMTLGFLGSFGHCVGMCSPLMAASSLAKVQDKPPTPWQQFIFHTLLNMRRVNMRRVLSYTQVGLALRCGRLGCRRPLGHSLNHSHLSSCRSLRVGAARPPGRIGHVYTIRAAVSRDGSPV